MLDEFFFCPERHGEKWRRVTEVAPSHEIEDYLRSRLPAPEKSPMKDLSHIYSVGARIFLVDNVGLVMKGVMDYKGLCDVHVGFWDLVLRGREDLCYKMASRVAHDAELAGVWTAIPLEARATLAFAKRVGFVEDSKSGSVAVLTLIT